MQFEVPAEGIKRCGSVLRPMPLPHPSGDSCTARPALYSRRDPWEGRASSWVDAGGGPLLRNLASSSQALAHTHARLAMYRFRDRRRAFCWAAVAYFPGALPPADSYPSSPLLVSLEKPNDICPDYSQGSSWVGSIVATTTQTTLRRYSCIAVSGLAWEFRVHGCTRSMLERWRFSALARGGRNEIPPGRIQWVQLLHWTHGFGDRSFHTGSKRTSCIGV